MKVTTNINTPDYWNGVYQREWESHVVGTSEYHRDYGPIHDAIVELIPNGARVLDIACGPGLLCRKIKTSLSNTAVTGVDFAAYAIARNTERDESLGIEYICMDVNTALASLPTQFDAITMCEIIEHLDDPISVVRDAISRLKHNGLFIVSCPHGNEIPDPEHVGQWDHESLFHLLAPYSSTISFKHFPPPYFHYWMLAYLRKDA